VNQLVPRGNNPLSHSPLKRTSVFDLARFELAGPDAEFPILPAHSGSPATVAKAPRATAYGVTKGRPSAPVDLATVRVSPRKHPSMSAEGQTSGTDMLGSSSAPAVSSFRVCPFRNLTPGAAAIFVDEFDAGQLKRLAGRLVRDLVRSQAP
jgi:hypothetical protein